MGFLKSFPGITTLGRHLPSLTLRRLQCTEKFSSVYIMSDDVTFLRV